MARSSLAGLLVRLLAAIAILLATLTAGIGTAGAHSDLLGSTPGDGTTVVGPISQIELTFNLLINMDASPTFEVIDGDGNQIAVASVSSADGIDVLIVLEEPVLEGVVGVGWSLISADTHAVTGNISFVVQAPPPTPTPVPTATAVPTEIPDATAVPNATAAPTEQATPTPEPTATAQPTQAAPVVVTNAPPPPDISDLFTQTDRLQNYTRADTVFRGIGYVATALALGMLAFLLLVETAAVDRPKVRRLLQSVLLLTFFVTLAVVSVQGATIKGGQAAQLFNPQAWSDALTGNFRTAAALRLAGVALASVVAARTLTIWTPGIRVLATFSGLFLLFSFPFFGHGATRSPQVVVFPSDLIHVAAISIWTGGLVAVLLALRSGTRWSTVVGRYSTVAGVALVASALAGILLAATELDSLSAIYNSSYGKRLVIKTFLVGIVAAMGAYNRFKVVPLFTSEATVERGRAHLLRIGAIEVALMVSVLLLTAWLVTAAS